MVRPTIVLPSATHGPIHLDPTRCEAFLEAEPLTLTPTEFDILHLLACNPGAVLTHDLLLETSIVRGKNPRAFTAHVYALRRKLGRHRGLISRVFGVGYRMASLGGQAHPAVDAMTGKRGRRRA